MARVLKEEDYASRRKEILEAARRLTETKGFEQMTIQDLLNELHISKGAFYHYFDSKEALLEALIEHLLETAIQYLTPLLDDPSLPPLTKMQRFFSMAARWKTAQRPFMEAMLEVWYADRNAIVRQKVFAATVKRIAPLLTGIIRQGVQEGVFSTPFPEQAGEVMLSVFQGLNETLADLLKTASQHPQELPHIESTIAAYNDAIGRIIGSAPGALELIDIQVIREWVAAPDLNQPATETELTS